MRAGCKKCGVHQGRLQDRELKPRQQGLDLRRHLLVAQHMVKHHSDDLDRQLVDRARGLRHQVVAPGIDRSGRRAGEHGSVHPLKTQSLQLVDRFEQRRADWPAGGHGWHRIALLRVGATHAGCSGPRTTDACGTARCGAAPADGSSRRSGAAARGPGSGWYRPFERRFGSRRRSVHARCRLAIGQVPPDLLGIDPVGAEVIQQRQLHARQFLGERAFEQSQAEGPGIAMQVDVFERRHQRRRERVRAIRVFRVAQ